MTTSRQDAFVIHGARGSRPISGAAFLRYGGSTTCFSVETDEGLIVIDAGTGIAALSDELATRSTLPPITLLFTHLHLDHIVGLPAFSPFLRKGAQVTLMADGATTRNWQSALHTIVGKPFWPFSLSQAAATLRCIDLPTVSRASGPIVSMSLYGVDVAWCPIRHPQGGISYRLKVAGSTIVVGTDREHGDAHLDKLFKEFARGADVLIHDAQYAPEEFPERTGWGHSTWKDSAILAMGIGAKQLVLTSHDPQRSDDEVDVFVQQARRIFSNTCAASEGMVIQGGRVVDAAPKEFARPPARQAASVAPARPAAAAPLRQVPGALTFRYTFRFDDGKTKSIMINLDSKTLELIPPERSAYPEWTALGHYQCSNCPLVEELSPQCPAAVGLIDVIEHFGQSISTEKVHVTIEGDARTYMKRASMPEAISSLIGMLMVTSGCPVMGKLRPMVRHHLPFATIDETRYRVLSMYLLAQYVMDKHGGRPDWTFEDLPKLYDEIRTVNHTFFKRLSGMEIEDANLNAIVRLDTFADSISFSMSQQDFADLEPFFRAYLDDTSGS